MSDLKTLYEKYNIDESQRVAERKKPVMLWLPDETTETKPLLDALGIDPYEVAYTWGKAGEDSLEILEFERLVVEPFVVLQVDVSLSKKYPCVPSSGKVSPSLSRRVHSLLKMSFVNLHHHDEYSIRDGLGTVTQLAKLLEARGNPFCCVTNHGSVGGWIKQYTTCKKAGLKSLYGMEAYLNDYRGDDPEERKLHRRNYHLSLWACTEEGFYNLIRLHNDAQLNGFYYKPRVTHDALKQFGKGIIGASACLAGEIPTLLMEDKWEEAKKVCRQYCEALDEFYIEITLIEMPEQIEVSRRLIRLAQEMNLPLIVSCDCLESSTRVVMEDGAVKPISDIKVGDRVATDNGESSIVEYVYSRGIKNGERAFRVRTGAKNHDIVCTENHPFLIEFPSGRREWVRSENLRVGDYLVVPHPKRKPQRVVVRTSDYFEAKKSTRQVSNGWISTRTDRNCIVPEFIDVDKEFCWLLGLYIAEGYRDNYVCGFGLHSDETEYAERTSAFFSGYGFCPTTMSALKSKSQSVRISSFGFAPLFEGLCGSGCSEKHLPYFWKSLDDECLASLLDGYFCGDGCFSNEMLSCTTTSITLVYQVQQAMLSLGFYANVGLIRTGADKRTGKKNRDQYYLSYGGKQLLQMQSLFSKIGAVNRKKSCSKGVRNCGEYHLVRVSRIDEITDTDGLLFWDITVKDRHCFVAESRVVHNSHYIEPEHAETHDILLLVKDGKTIHDKQDDKEEVWQFDARNLYCRDGDAMYRLFKEGFYHDSKTNPGTNEHFAYEDNVFTEEIFLEAMVNTLRIARKIEDIQLDGTFKLPKLYDNGPKVLRKKAAVGLANRGLAGKSGYQERLDYELDVICDLGFADYFLAMEKIITDTREKWGEWSTGYGRGSASGSLVSYCLRITDLDPIEYGLLFERFLDASRKDDCPDIDTDFDPRIRDWVKSHIVKTFSEEKTCSIGTHQTYKTRAVLQDVARALAIDQRETISVTKLLEGRFEDDDGDSRTIDDMDFDEICQNFPELDAYLKKYPEVRIHADVMRNQVKNAGKHAGGVIISNLNLQGRIPVFRDKSGVIVSSWAEGQATHELSAVGLVKFDILGLNNLSVISDCIDYIYETRGIRYKRDSIPLNDCLSIQKGCKSEMVGIFQFENPSTKPVVDAVKMDSIFDISAVTSLIRPGPRAMGMDMEYANRKSGGSYSIPKFIQDALEETYGILVYQENVMLIAQLLGGMTPIESNQLRSAIAKKRVDKLPGLKAEFMNGAQKRVSEGHITNEEVEKIWENIESFGGYGFNKSHAMAYSAVTAVEFWLKGQYPVEFITALLNNTAPNKKKFGTEPLLVEYINYARRHDIPVLPPDINASKASFTIDAQKIRYSLSHIKNVAKSAEDIAALAPFTDLADFYERVPKRRVNKRVVESLIFAGAFDCFGDKNEVLLQYYELRKSKEPPKTLTEDAWIDKEKEVLGLCLSQEPLVRRSEQLIAQNGWTTISDLTNRKRATVFGKIESIQSRTSKKGNPMLVCEMSDGLDSMSFYVFQGERNYFSSVVKCGFVVAIPMKRFDDGNAWFFAGSCGPADCVIVSR